ncbi:MAG: adenylosuccinate synthase, partial [Chloroflexi bacterium]|nr:adenylosuccinate synthase [Chloroflexota bacterium]
TVVNPHGHFKLHLIPSGIFHPGTRNLLGNGVVINPPALVGEIRELALAGFDAANLFISDRAHLVMPYHVLLDQLEERERGAGKLGTTSRGIGPAYVDKVARRGIRVVDLMDADAFRTRLNAALLKVRRQVDACVAAIGTDAELEAAVAEATDPGVIEASYLAAGETLRAHVVDGQAMVDEALARGERILLEGQLGTMRDIDWGIYPFVTSSSPIPGGASIGAGLPAVAIDQVLGVAKAYTTAVGAGPLPTELVDADGAALRERGVEYGTSTGRARRCGWYDAVAVHFSVRLAGYSSIALTKLDVLDGFERIRIGVAYRDSADGREWTTVPASASVYERFEPVYEELPGWQADTTACRSWDDLPDRARAYVERLEALAGTPISHVSVGPERAQMIVRE